MKTLLQYRPEQYIFDELIIPNFQPILLNRSLEKKILVSHPELSPQPYVTRIDNWYLLKGVKRNISMCFDLHGTWHEKDKVQARDWKKRQVLEWNGHHYIEIRGYTFAEECMALWEVLELKSELQSLQEKRGNLERRKVFYDKYQAKMSEAAQQIGNQIVIQMAQNHPRNVDCLGLI